MAQVPGADFVVDPAALYTLRPRYYPGLCLKANGQLIGFDECNGTIDSMTWKLVPQGGRFRIENTAGSLQQNYDDSLVLDRSGGTEFVINISSERGSSKFWQLAKGGSQSFFLVLQDGTVEEEILKSGLSTVSKDSLKVAIGKCGANHLREWKLVPIANQK